MSASDVWKISRRPCGCRDVYEGATMMLRPCSKHAAETIAALTARLAEAAAQEVVYREALVNIRDRGGECYDGARLCHDPQQVAVEALANPAPIADALLKVVEAARACYEHDDFVTVTSDDSRARDAALGDALSALDAARKAKP